MTAKNHELMAATSIAGDVYSAPFLNARLLGFAVTNVVQGNAAGTVKLQSCDDEGTIPEAGEYSATGLSNWNDIANATLPVAGTGNYSFNCANLYFRWVRVAYVATSGAGTMASRVSGEARK